MRGPQLLSVAIIALLLGSTVPMVSADPIVDEVIDESEELREDLPSKWPIQQNDAGSGEDAPNEPEPGVWIESGEIYQGTLGDPIEDGDDYYAFTGEAGDVVQAKVRGMNAFYRITNENGHAMDKNLKGSTIGRDALLPHGDPTGIFTGPTYVTVELPEPGLYFLRVDSLAPQHYALSIGINEEAPEPGFKGLPLPPPLPLEETCDEQGIEEACAQIPGFPETCEAHFSDVLCRFQRSQDPSELMQDPSLLGLQQDDAGSDQDAPGEAEPEVWIESGEVYNGTTMSGFLFTLEMDDTEDHYAFWGEAGDVVQATARSTDTRFEIGNGEDPALVQGSSSVGKDLLIPQGVDAGIIVPLQRPTTIEATLEETGVHYLSFYGGIPQRYSFSIGINEDAIAPEDGDVPLPPLFACDDVFSNDLCGGDPDVEEHCRIVLSEGHCSGLPS